jgi:hypothetical protein
MSNLAPCAEMTEHALRAALVHYSLFVSVSWFEFGLEAAAHFGQAGDIRRIYLFRKDY